jgi:putative transcriptional regulator
MESLRGKLLVASPSLLDPNFSRTVLLIAEHSDEGAMGLVLNRVSEVDVGDAAPDLADLIEPGEMVHAGGPVQTSAVMILAEFDDPATAATLVLDRVGFVGADADFEALAADVVRARVFAGMAGWAPGQLEAELERDDWIVEPATADDVFADPGSLWSTVLERKGGQYALVARMPPDPSLN